jgi:hypothetical protein
MNYQLLAFVTGSALTGMAYLMKCMYRRESQTARVHRGLRRYVRRNQYAAPEMSL